MRHSAAEVALDRLVTRRLVLRPMVAEDTDALLAVFGDPTVMASFGVPPFDRLAMDRWVARNLEHQAHHGYGLFTVVERESGVVIGDCGLEHLDEEGGVAELGYDLRADRWGRGFATEAATAVRDHAFGSLGLPRLVSLIREENGTSHRVAEKVGMRHVADLERFGRAYRRYAIEAATMRG